MKNLYLNSTKQLTLRGLEVSNNRTTIEKGRLNAYSSYLREWIREEVRKTSPSPIKFLISARIYEFTG